jgi:hypothetical protein
MGTIEMPCRIEELPFLADFTRDSFVRDTEYFKAFSPEFGNNYLQTFDSQAQLVNEVVSPSLLMAEQKAITSRIAAHYTNARNITNRLERYTEMATDAKLLKITVSDFGFKTLRKEIDRNNDEAVVKKLGEALQQADNNREALEPMGFTPAFRQELATFIQSFATDILNQKRKKEERLKLTENNSGQFSVLWKMISNIQNTGKVIFKEKDKSKLKDYTYTDLIKKVRLQRKKEDNGESTAKENK